MSNGAFKLFDIYFEVLECILLADHKAQITPAQKLLKIFHSMYVFAILSICCMKLDNPMH